MSRFPLQDLERLNTWLPEIAAAFRGAVPAKPQPDGSVRVGRKGSLVLGPGAGLWYDFETATGGHDALSLIRHLGAEQPLQWARTFLTGHSGNGRLTDKPSVQTLEALEPSLAAANHFLATAVPVDETPGAEYLRGRGIESPHPDTLKFIAEARHGEGALMAVVTSDQGATAVQLTYLDASGRKSTVAPERRIYRRQLDWSTAGSFTLTSPTAPERTVITEGVEDALSLWKADAGSTVVASLGVANIGKSSPSVDEDIIVFRDGDEPGAPAEKGLARGIDRLILAGATVRVTETPEGSDANDLFISDGAGSLLRLIDEAPSAELSPEGWFEKCAGMPRLEYEVSRSEIAGKLGLRLCFLDDEVAFRRRDQESETEPQTLAAGLEDLEPWPEEVELDAVLSEIAPVLAEYVHLDPTGIDTLALWAAHTHVLDIVPVSPRLALQSPGPACGKTVTLEALSNLVPRPLTAASITSASVFRLIEAAQPTLLIDEVDQLFRGENADLLAVMNSSQRRSTAFVVRVVEVMPGQYEPTRFATWAAAVFAGIRELPPTLQDRSIVIRLQRALPGEVRRHLRDGHCPVLAACGRKLTRWSQNVEELSDGSMPPALSNRVGDNWRPLFGIAALAGGDWPDRVLAAAKVSLASGDQGAVTLLLADIRDVFGERDRMSSSEIVDALLAREEAPYGEINRGRSITQHWLARHLNGVIRGSSTTIRTGSRTNKGYYREQFEEAWRRYCVAPGKVDVHCEPPDVGVTTVTTSQPPKSAALGGIETVTPHSSQRHTSDGDAQMLRCDDPDVTVVGSPNPKESATCDVVTDNSGDLEETPPAAADQEVW